MLASCWKTPTNPYSADPNGFDRMLARGSAEGRILWLATPWFDYEYELVKDEAHLQAQNFKLKLSALVKNKGGS